MTTEGVVRESVEPELTFFAQSAGTTLVTLMTTDVWQRVSERLTQLWHGIQPQRAETVAAELEADRADVLTAVDSGDEATLDELRAQWQGRLRRLLVAEPGAREELRRLLDEFSPPQATDAPGVAQHASASGQARIYQAGRDQHIAER
jgi:hypothetical protein